MTGGAVALMGQLRRRGVRILADGSGHLTVRGLFTSADLDKIRALKPDLVALLAGAPVLFVDVGEVSLDDAAAARLVLEFESTLFGRIVISNDAEKALEANEEPRGSTLVSWTHLGRLLAAGRGPELRRALREIASVFQIDGEVPA